MKASLFHILGYYIIFYIGTYSNATNEIFICQGQMCIYILYSISATSYLFPYEIIMHI